MLSSTNGREGDPERVRMKLSVTLRSGAGASEHELELDGTGQDGEGRCRLDGADSGRANWARVEPGVYSILVGGRSYEVRVGPEAEPNEYAVRIGSVQYRVAVHDPRTRRRASAATAAGGPKTLTAPMPSKVVKVLVREGDEVAEGQGLLVTEAMKMQNELRAPRAGRVEHIHVAEGAGVETGAPLVRLA
jgi:biotin carboxyl carrier protein